MHPCTTELPACTVEAAECRVSCVVHSPFLQPAAAAAAVALDADASVSCLSAISVIRVCSAAV